MTQDRENSFKHGNESSVYTQGGEFLISPASTGF